MIRVGLVLTIFVVIMNATLLVTETQGYNDFGAFADLSSGLNQFRNVGASTDLSFAESEFFGGSSNSLDFFGYINAATVAGFGAIKLTIVLLAGSIQVVALLDPTNTWGLLILGPIAAIQVFYFLFLVLTIASTILGSIRRN